MAGSAIGAACFFFPFLEWRTKKSPKGSGKAAALWAAIPGVCLPVNRGRRSGGWLPVQAGNARAAGAERRAAAGVFEMDAGRGDDGAGKAACGRFVEQRPRQSLGILGRRGVSGHGSARRIFP